MLDKLEARKTVLLVDNGENRNLSLGSRNLPGVTLVPSREVSVYDLLGHERVLMSRGGRPETLGGVVAMNIYDVIRRPLVTEKGVAKKEAERTLCFEVDPRANKVQIRAAVEKLFKVKVEDVQDRQPWPASCAGGAASAATGRTGRRPT